MNPSIMKMWLSCLLVSSIVSLASSAGNEYLPPSNGYNYPTPPVVFHTPTPPTQTPYRPPSVPSRPPYNPPTPTRRPSIPPVHDHPHSHPPSNGDHDHGHDDHHHHEPGMPFDFSYTVNEDGNDYSHNAVSDGDITRGEYRVALPDGRTQIVKYTADWKNGFNAEVSYEGEARYPDQPQGGYGGPSPGGQYVPPNQGGGYQY